MTYSFTAEQVTPVIEAVVAEYGEDYVYEKRVDGFTKCDYVRDNKPSCLVAHVLHRLGVPLKRLSEFEGINVYGLHGLVELDLGAFRGLQNAQMVQDEGLPWGEALRWYRRQVEGLVSA